jgi:hypothetical protein
MFHLREGPGHIEPERLAGQGSRKQVKKHSEH